MLTLHHLRVFCSYAWDEWVMTEQHAELQSLQDEVRSLREQKPTLSRTRSGRGYHATNFLSNEVRAGGRKAKADRDAT